MINLKTLITRASVDKQYQGMRGLLYDAVVEIQAKIAADARAKLRRGHLGLKPKTRLFDKRIKKAPPGYLRLEPLTTLASGISHTVNTTRDDYIKGKAECLQGTIGFLDPMSWQARIALKSIPGYKWLYTKKDRMKLLKFGILLRPKTKSAKVPPRDIMGAILSRYPEYRIIQDIKTLFELKLRGKDTQGG